MPHATLGPAQRDADLQRLDEVIADLGHSQENRDDLLIQHLQSARTYLLGAMPEEYAFGLRSACENLSLVRDEPSRRRVGDNLSSLLHEIESTGTSRDGQRLSASPRTGNVKVARNSHRKLFSLQHLLDRAGGLARALRIFDQGEAHESLAQRSESDARRNRNQRFLEQHF
jgi:hypothetical protein